MDADEKIAAFKQYFKCVAGHFVVSFASSEYLYCRRQPDFLSGGKLYDYQLDGLNFLHSAWRNNINVILAGTPPLPS